MFQKATRKDVKIKLAITGPTGSGKTFSALRLAKGMGGKIAVVDTENGSASLYSDKFDFDVVNLSPPFNTKKYVEAVDAAVKEGYDTVVIDSLSHAWAGPGGVLDRKSDYDLHAKGNSFTNWQKFGKEQDAFIQTILQSPINVICTMRSKTAYQIIENEKGKAAPVKMGLAPVQRDGVEYEFSIIFDCQMDHKAEASKDRTTLFTDEIFQITEETGKTIKDWLLGAEENAKKEIEALELQINKNINNLKDEQMRKSFASKVATAIDKKDLMKLETMNNWLLEKGSTQGGEPRAN
jgi:hypothetical protein